MPVVFNLLWVTNPFENVITLTYLLLRKMYILPKLWIISEQPQIT